MSNEFYDNTGYPAANSLATSAGLRAELEKVEVGLNKLPTMAGNNNKPVKVNAAGTALEAGAIAKADVGLANVTNDAQLKIASNLSDVANVATSRTNLGLGTIATQAADNVAITGGSITGITDLAVADGGTGASDAGTARTNLGLGTAATATVGHTAGNVVPAGGANGALTVGTNDATALTLKTNNASRVTVDSAGNVGIGTSVPLGTLHVNKRLGSQPVPFGSEPQVVVGGSQGGGGAQGYMGSLWFASADDEADFSKAAGIVGNATTDFSPTSREGHLEFYTTPAGSITPTERLRIDASGNVGIGKTIPTMKLHVLATAVAPSATADNGILSIATTTTNELQIGGYSGSPFAMWIQAKQTNNSGSTFPLHLNPVGGDVLVTGSGGLGYGVGSGGTVTQATSKSTNVTLNKPCGRITMNSAALAANSTVNFLLNNTLISANDTVQLTLSGGVTSGDYYLVWGVVAAGSCRIRVRNIHSSSLSDAVQINFAIIKGALS